MKTKLDFDKEDTKKFISKFSYEYFLNKNIEEEGYTQANIDEVYKNYRETKDRYKKIKKKDKEQFNLYLDGMVRKMFTGGSLPALYLLDESTNTHIFNFEIVGKDWAYFELWQKYYRRKLTKEKIWNYTVKSGSVLAIILTIVKIFEIINLNRIIDI